MIKVDLRSDGIAVVTLGALGAPANVGPEAFLFALDEVAPRLRDDPHVAGAVLLSGTPRGFAVGLDLREAQRLRLARDGEQLARGWASRLMRLRGIGKPVVAAVHGAVTSAGLELALACADIVASDDVATRFSFPEVQLGLLPCGNGLLRLAERAGLQVALDLGQSGAELGAEGARRSGLVDEVVPRALLVEAAAWRARTGRRKRSRRHRMLGHDLVARGVALGAPRLSSRSSARRRIADVLTRWSRDGFHAAAELEARAFGELLVSEPSRRLVAVAIGRTAAPPSTSATDLASYAKRIQSRAVNEALFLLADGVSSETIHHAFVDWGWSRGPLPLAAPPSPRATASPIRIEEIQMRGVLGLVNEALSRVSTRRWSATRSTATFTRSTRSASPHSEGARSATWTA